MEQTTKQELIEYIKDNIQQYEGTLGGELHNELFNRDFYITGRGAAEEWLTKNGGVFNAIGEIKDYEQNNFGEVNTDLSEPERVVNMYVYIKGEEILNESETISNNYDLPLTEELINQIISELN